MTRSLVVVLTSNAEFALQLRRTLDAAFDVRVAISCRELKLDDMEAPLAGLVLDRASIAMRTKDRRDLLADVSARHPRCAVIELREPQATRRDADEVAVFKGSIEPVVLPRSTPVERVAVTLAELAPPETVEPETHAAPKSTSPKNCKTTPPAQTAGELSRRFETHTPAVSRMLADLETAARHDVTILLVGETGSGKTYLSRQIHDVSPRRDEPFITVACGALPGDLIESELFGHVKGSFTGAHADKDGKFVAAGGGTLLLDEIDVLEPEQQVKLLRVIETGEFEPVGSNRTVTSAARLVVASNLDLAPLVEKGRFRPDLYYRLSMLRFDLPPLRNRAADVRPLVRRFIERRAAHHGVEIGYVEEAFFAGLEAYPWPGNVRELENVVERAVIYCREGVLKREHLPPHVVAGKFGPTNDPSVTIAAPASADSFLLEEQVAMTERQVIEEALFRNNQSRTNTARELGISRVTLYNKMKKHELQN